MVKNTLQRKTAATGAVTYEASGVQISLTPDDVKKYLVSGDETRVNTKELVVFMNLCKSAGLNPWAKEAYLIKYGNEPATMVIGKEAYLKRAESNENFDGFEAGVILMEPQTRSVRYQDGCFRMPDEEIIGGYAKVYRKDRTHPYIAEVTFTEYAGRKKDGSLNGQWQKKPGTMIRKVALVQALREAFPSAFGGMYAEEEAVQTEDIYLAPEPTPVIEEKEEEKEEEEIF